MKIVVTGGSGFIGSHVVEALRLEGHHLTNLDVCDGVAADRFVEADIRDIGTLIQAFRAYGKDAVFHIAGIANARMALSKPVDAVDINIRGTACVLEAARQAEVKRVILASTVWVYNAANRRKGPTRGAAGDVCHLVEDEPIRPQGGGHVYTTSKIASELLCHDFYRLYGQEFTILRYGIPYGPRMWVGLALRAFLDNVFAGRHIRIFGDGSAARRFLYVEDVARAHVPALSDVARNQTYNLEGKCDVSIKELAETVAKFVKGVEIEYIDEPSRRGELSTDGIVISNEKAKRDLGWEPVTELDDGVRRTIEWYRKEVVVQ